MKEVYIDEKGHVIEKNPHAELYEDVGNKEDPSNFKVGEHQKSSSIHKMTKKKNRKIIKAVIIYLLIFIIVLIAVNIALTYKYQEENKLKNNLKKRENSILCENMEAKGYSKMLVGVGRTIDGISNSIEIIDLKNTNKTCAPIQNFPSKVYAPIGGLTFNGRPMICGGETDRNFKSACFTLTNKSWDASPDMVKYVAYTSAVPSPFDDFSGIFVAGGHVIGKPDILNTTEHFGSNSWTETSPSLPISTWLHCSAKINFKTAIVTGGIDFSRQTYILNTASEEGWTKGPKMHFGRQVHSCGRIRRNSQSCEYDVIVVGGENETHPMTSVEILDSQIGDWRAGPDLPYGIMSATLVTDSRGGVILVGGEAKHEKHLNTLWRLDHAGKDAKWELMPQRLKIGRHYQTSFLIPDSVESNCD